MVQGFEHRNENQGHCSPGCLGRQHCLSAPLYLGDTRVTGLGWEGDEGGTSVIHAFPLPANLCPPTPVRQQRKGSSVYFVEVLRPSLRFFVLAYILPGVVYHRNKGSLDGTSIVTLGSKCSTPNFWMSYVFFRPWFSKFLFIKMSSLLEDWQMWLPGETEVVTITSDSYLEILMMAGWRVGNPHDCKNCWAEEKNTWR